MNKRAKYSSLGTTKRRWGHERSLADALATGESRILSAEIAELIETCRPFRTLSEHRDVILASRPGSPANARKVGRAIDSCLEEFVRLGLLVSEQELFNALDRSPTGSIRPPPIEILATPTANRPVPLRSCLDSFARHAAKTGRDFEHLVVCDARSTEAVGATRSALGQLAKSVCIRYANRQDRQGFADRLAQAGAAEPKLARFALLGAGFINSVGASRNAILLDTTGSLCLSVDDDIVCRPAASPANDRSIALSPCGKTEVKRAFPTGSPAVHELDEAAFPLFEEHERFLGATLKQCVYRARCDGHAIHWERMPSTLGDYSGGAVPVVLTQGGIYGDNASDAEGYFWMRPKYRGSLLKSQDWFEDCVKSRQALIVESRASLYPAGNLGGAHFGFDNRVLLPPFLPNLRGEDAVFAVTLRSFARSPYQGSVPVALHHDPQPPRTASLDDVWEDIRRVKLHAVMSVLLAAGPVPQTTDPASALKLLGRGLADAAAAPPADFHHRVRELVLQRADDAIRLLEAQLSDDPELPEFYKPYLRRYIRTVREAAVSRLFSVPSDVEQAVGPDDAPDLTQDTVSMFGRLLVAWPDMVQATSELRQRGIRISHELSPAS